MEFENILIEIDAFIAIVTIDRPKKLNALNKQTIAELHRAFAQLDANKDVRVIILTGTGDKAFVAGADISEFASFSVAQGEQLSAEGQELLFNYVENLSTPVIAAVNGFALGGGLELAMSCHFRIASENAKLGLPEVSLGVIPGYGGTQRLPQLVGKGKAMEMIMTGGMINAEEAYRWGLVNQTVPQEDLMAFCRKIADRIAKNSPVAIAYAIKAINAGYKSNALGFATEIESFGACFGTDDFEEGTNAFLEKRKAEFTGT